MVFRHSTIHWRTLPRNRFLHRTPSLPLVRAVNVLAAGRTFRSRCITVQYGSSSHRGLIVLPLNQLHGSAPVWCLSLPTRRERAVRIRVCVRVCLPFCLANPPWPAMCVQMNSEIRDLNPGNWKVRIKLAAVRPSVRRRFALPFIDRPRAASLPSIPFSRAASRDRYPFRRDKRFRAERVSFSRPVF